jgi:hypothetical protein
VAGETEVLAQVKLKMHTVAGQPVVVTRRIQASQKKKKIEMKTLEGMIQRIDPATGQVWCMLACVCVCVRVCVCVCHTAFDASIVLAEVGPDLEMWRP